MTLTQLAFPLAIVATTMLAVVVLTRGGRGARETALACGLVGLALEAAAAYVAVGWTETPEDRGRWLRVVMALGVIVLVPWTEFVRRLLASPERRLARSRLIPALAGAGAVTVSGMMWLGEPLVVSDLPGSFYAVRLADTGIYAVIAQLLGTVAILAGLELCLRTADRDTRWRLKYLVLGLGGLFLVRFYLLSHVLLFHVLLAAYLTTGAAALFLAATWVGLTATRRPLQQTTFVVSRSVALRSVVVALLGLYLFIVGGLGWFLNRLGLSEELFWGSLLVFVGAATAGALMLSETLRWRVRRFIGVHFYRSKYDYRVQWIAFTRRLASSVQMEELAPQLLAATTDAVGTAKGILYLGGDDDYRLGAALEVYSPPPALPGTSPLVRRARSSTAPVLVPDGERPAWFPQARILVPLTWQGSLTGIMILAGERTDRAYSEEDVEFLAAVGVQLAAALTTARLSETVARSREFEAFHRLTSFVAHDLKNAVSSLSMLSENAREHLDNPEFQRDAIVTVGKTTERMRRLLRRLTSAGEVPLLRSDPVDLAALIGERIVRLVRAPHVKVTVDLHPSPVRGDAEALERVLQNLVINAVEALDGGGEITLRAFRRDTTVVCEVSDTGCGMSPEFQQRSLFVPFRSGKKGGWGIGLYHAREIVLAHGGRIEVESAEGRGTTFTLTFPLLDGGQEATA